VVLSTNTRRRLASATGSMSVPLKPVSIIARAGTTLVLSTADRCSATHGLPRLKCPDATSMEHEISERGVRSDLHQVKDAIGILGPGRLQRLFGESVC
jgi:hypothetical protein